MSDQNPPNEPSPPGGSMPPPAPSWDAPPPPPAAPAADWSGGSPGYSAGSSPVPAGSTASTAPEFFTATFMMNNASPPAGWAPKQKMVAGLLGILIGSLGIHSFYLGNSKKGIIQIVASVFTCGLGGIWGLIDGIMILIGNAKTDAYGVPLTD